MDVDVVVLALVRLAPHGAQEAALGHEAAGVGQQDAQDLELAGRELHAPLADADLVAHRRRARAGRRQPALRVARGPAGAAQGDPDPRVELVDPERLGHVVVGAALERLDLLALLVAAGQDHDRRRRLAADAPDDVEALDVGQAEVEEDERPAGGPPSARAPSRPSAAWSTR